MTGSISPELPSGGEPRSTSDSKVKGSLITLRDGLNNLLNSENKVAKASLEAGAAPVTWYTPKVIATEESRTNTAFGTLTTADEIKSVVLPENGLICVSYRAFVKSSVASAGTIALFVGSNQCKNAIGGESTSKSTSGTETSLFIFKPAENEAGEPWLRTSGAFTDATTGQIASDAFVPIFAAAGTYNISVQYKASSGSVTAKARKLWVYTVGV
jgi:hypothetical protein